MGELKEQQSETVQEKETDELKEQQSETSQEKETDGLREQQLEALQVLKEYNQKLTKSVLLVMEELRGARKKDTNEFLNKIIEGINWEIQIYNRTKDLLNEGKVRVDKEEMNGHVVKFGEVMKEKEDAQIADSFEADILPLLTKLGDAAKEVLEEQNWQESKAEEK